MTAVCVMAAGARTQDDLFPEYKHEHCRGNTLIFPCFGSFHSHILTVCNHACCVYVNTHTSANAHLTCVNSGCIICSENRSSLDIFLDQPDLITPSLGESCDCVTSISRVRSSQISHIHNVHRRVTLRMEANFCFYDACACVCTHIQNIAVYVCVVAHPFFISLKCLLRIEMPDDYHHMRGGGSVLIWDTVTHVFTSVHWNFWLLN